MRSRRGCRAGAGLLRAHPGILDGMTDTSKPVDTTVDPSKHSKGEDADQDQTGEERTEAVDEFDGHLDGSGEKPSLPTPAPTEVADQTDEKTVTRSE